MVVRRSGTGGRLLAPGRPVLRSDFLLLLVGSMSIAALCPSCGTAENVPAQADAAAASDAAAKVECPADAGATSSLAGTVETSGFFASMKLAEVSLYAVYPYGTQPSVALTPQNVTPDLSGRAAWSFGCLSAGTHYYLQATGHFKVADAKPASVATIVGPLTVPSIGPALAVRVQPLQVAVLESRSAGTTARQLEWASAHGFDPATGEEISGACTR